MRSKKKNKMELEGNSLIDGIEISGNFYEKNENRILTLLLKGIIVYLVTAGMIGGAITATATEFSQIVFNVIIFMLSMLISIIYYNKKTENIGDILYLFMIIFFGLFFGTYINSGFYAWMNDIIGAAGAYFDLPDIGGYVQAIRNTKLAVTFASCYLGAVCVILVNMSIVKRMMFGDLFLNSMIVLFLPVYLELEPNFIYIVFLVSGIVIADIWKVTGKYEKVDSNSVYIRNKKEITYTYSFKGHLFAFSQMIAAVLLILMILYIILPNDTYDLLRGRSESKEVTDDVVETFITSGFAGFFNRYENIGGMNSGRLGGVNSVRLDYETDLKVTYVPVDMRPVYLRTFIGGDYQPYRNMWSVANPTILNRSEAQELRKNYENGAKYSAKAVMDIENIAGEIGEYAPYYSEKGDVINRGKTVSKTFYPSFDETEPYHKNTKMTRAEREYWLSVPNDNVPSLIKTIEKLGITEDMDEFEISDRIYRYFLENIPYTLRPGSTPIRRDFVNYFLDSNKKGYCVHFASASVLLFRYMGIPARYVEGYAFDYIDVRSGQFRDDLKFEDYYDGYLPDEKMPVISLEITDASAHAWVEIYTEDYGWVVAELTPPSSDTEEYGQSLWDRFLKLFGNNNSDENNADDDNNTKKIDTAKIRRNLIIFIFLAIISVTVYALYRLIGKYLRYKKADLNTKLVYRYHDYLKKASKKHDLNNAHNYKDELIAIMGDDYDEKLLNILEKAGFSDKIISDEEFYYCIERFKKV
ncbi:MAG: transglutaminase-like domain-containing protein [Lachnospiraceae bacterium]|nr:transglutaminase-like domain-containing protein [Lachnospiraceae bacterium]